jgi:hypothetical protein
VCDIGRWIGLHDVIKLTAKEDDNRDEVSFGFFLSISDIISRHMQANTH